LKIVGKFERSLYEKTVIFLLYLKVEKYEEEQKSLFEELTIAHSKLVELKLNIAELEEQKVSFMLYQQP
jgi:hypothetical protein